MKYKVCVDDNFHYMDESARYTHGEFETAEAAISAARAIVDEFLLSAFKPGMTPGQLYAAYTGFGEDPFIVSDDETCKFSAWSYSGQRSVQLCADSEVNRDRKTPNC